MLGEKNIVRGWKKREITTIGKKYEYNSPIDSTVTKLQTKFFLSIFPRGANPLIINNFISGKDINKKGRGAKYEFQIRYTTLKADHKKNVTQTFQNVWQ